MPWFEAILPRLNRRLTKKRIANFPIDVFDDPDVSLVSVLEKLDVFNGYEAARPFVDQMPAALQEAILATFRSNVRRETRKQMIVSWAPGYDWEVRIWETGSTAETAGGITIQVRSRYPNDPRPAP